MVAEIALVSGKTYHYRYLLNDGRWVNDFSGTTEWVEAFGNYVENNVVEVPLVRVSTTVTNNATAKKEQVKKTLVTKVADKKLKPVTDDLTKIEGIGKKIATLLKKHHILSYKDLAKSTIKNLKTILQEGGPQYGMHNPGSWPKQAKLAAAGKWEELAALQADLIGGK